MFGCLHSEKKNTDLEYTNTLIGLQWQAGLLTWELHFPYKLHVCCLLQPDELMTMFKYSKTQVSSLSAENTSVSLDHVD